MVCEETPFQLWWTDAMVAAVNSASQHSSRYISLSSLTLDLATQLTLVNGTLANMMHARLGKHWHIRAGPLGMLLLGSQPLGYIQFRLFFFFFFFFCFLEMHPRHMEVPRLGVKAELQLLTYATATETWDLSYICHLYHSS